MAPGEIDSTRSVGTKEAEHPRPEPPLSSRAVAEIAVVGGGLTGVSTAWHLSQRLPGRGIILIEAGILGNGASGRSGGQVLHWINGVTTEDPGELRRIHAATDAGIDLAETLAARYAPPGTFPPPRAPEAAHARVERLARTGIPARFLAGDTLGIQGVHGAILDPTAGRLNGFALL